MSARILRSVLLPGEPAPFVLELPPYRLPTLSGVLLHAWERMWSYLKNAGTVVVSATVVIWLMMSFPGLPAEQQAEFDNRIAALEAQIEAAAPGQGMTELEARKASVEADAGRPSPSCRHGLRLPPLPGHFPGRQAPGPGLIIQEKRIALNGKTPPPGGFFWDARL